MSDSVTYDAALHDEWVTSLRAEKKSPRTVHIYDSGVTHYIAWCMEHGRPSAFDRKTVNSYLAAEQARGMSSATLYSRYIPIRQYVKFMVAEGEADFDVLDGLKPPQVGVVPVPSLTDAQCRALVNACKGDRFADRRDEAIVRLLLDTGIRADELVSLDVTDIDLRDETAVVKGKGDKVRVVAFGAKTSRALARYLRMRRTHRLAASPALWLGDRGKTFTYKGMYPALKKRAESAGIKGFHPHITRHTTAVRFIAKGGSEGSLMQIAGWTRREMLDRYVAAHASDMAMDEARSLKLDDF